MLAAASKSAVYSDWGGGSGRIIRVLASTASKICACTRDIILACGERALEYFNNVLRTGIWVSTANMAAEVVTTSIASRCPACTLFHRANEGAFSATRALRSRRELAHGSLLVGYADATSLFKACRVDFRVCMLDVPHKIGSTVEAL